MKILEIKKNFEPVLRMQSQPVGEVTPVEQELLLDMLFTMHKFNGIGLAAPQIGIGQRIIVADLGAKPVKLFNPEVLEVKGKATMAEGCLSLPSYNIEVVRPTEVVIAGLDEMVRRVEFRAKDLLARVILHEIDHLNGKLIVDYMSPWKKLFRRKR